MLKAIDYNVLTKILYNKLILFSEIEKTQIRNIDGLQGADIEKLISSTKIDSLELSDSFIIFEIIENSDMLRTIEENDNTISTVISYDFIVRCYGRPAHMLANKILARFRTDDNLLDLRSKGIYANNLEPITTTKEFINNLWWPRCDFTIKMIVRYSTPKNKEGGYFAEELSDITLYTV